MTTPSPLTPSRDALPAVLAGLLYLLLLVSLRDVLTPPLVLPLALAALWPLRDRPGVRIAMAGAVLLTLAWALMLYGGLLGPFILALGVAYLLAPLVDQLEQRGVKRGLAILLVVLPPLTVVVVLVAITGPQLWAQAVAVANAMPRFATTALELLSGLRARLEGLAFLTEEQRLWLHDLDAAQVASLLQQHADGLLRAAAEWGLAFVRRLGTLLGFLGYLVITPVVAFYLLRDWRPLLIFVEELIPAGPRPALVAFLNEYDTSLGRFIRGQLIEATLVGVLTGAGLAILGVPSALLLGVIGGLANLIPYVGFAIAIVPALIVALTMPDPIGGLLRVGGVFLVVQFIDGNVTGPKIVGGSVGLHPVATMLALTFGGAVLGFAGLLLAIPLAVLGKMLLSRLLARYRASAVYGGKLAADS